MNQLLRAIRLFQKHRKLAERRGGLKRHVKLEYTFHQIGQDKYVKRTRRQYES